MLSKKIEKLLNEQIVKEGYASSSYLSMASWCATQSLKGTTEFLYAQSDEERVHMLKLVKYINDAGGHAVVPAVKEPPATYKSVPSMFETAYTQEKDVTASIYRIVDQCFTEKDFAAFNFLQWFVSEQLEEENLFRSVMDLLKMAGPEGYGLLVFDGKIQQLREDEEKES